MNPKKLASIIIVIAGALLIALVLQNLGDKTFERNEYAKPVPPGSGLTPEEREALILDLHAAEANSSWQVTRLSTLRGSAPSASAIAAAKAEVERSVSARSKALKDAYEVAKDAVGKTDIPFIQAQQEIKAKKADIDSIISKWKDQINSSHPPTVTQVDSYLNSVHDYLTAVETILDNITPEGSGLTQEQIDAYKQQVAESIAEVNNTITSLKEAEQGVQHAQEALQTQENVGNPKAIDEQIQKVLDAEAELAALKDKIKDEPVVNSPITTPMQSYQPEPFDDPNIKYVPLPDPSKPHLLQD